MRLTKRKALVICKELWEWIRDNAKTIEHWSRKKRWPGWDKYGDMLSDCPCCEYRARRDRPCADCLLAGVWGSGDCCRLPSPYEKWRKAATARTRKKYAQKIVDGCTATLAALPKLKRRKK